MRVRLAIAFCDVYALRRCPSCRKLLRHDADPVADLLISDLHGRSALPLPLWIWAGIFGQFVGQQRKLVFEFELHLAVGKFTR